jgi:hypothetical protein
VGEILIADKALITPKGILFLESYYTCANAIRENWFVRHAEDTKQVKVYYDPSCLNSIFIMYEDIAMIPAYKVTFDEFQSLDPHRLNMYYQTIEGLLEKRRWKNRIQRRNNFYKREAI